MECAGEVRHGDAVVLVARGHGRPRMGMVRGRQLIGDAGERCLEARWCPAGRLIGVHRSTVAVGAVSDVGGDHVVRLPRPAPRRASTLASDQLSLFGGVAA